MRTKSLQKTRGLLCLAMLWLTGFVAHAQVTTEFIADSDWWKDVTIMQGSATSWNQPTPPSQLSYGTYEQIGAAVTYAPTSPIRTFFRMNLIKKIPQGTIIQSAKLVLKASNIADGMNYGHRTNFGNNAVYFQKVTQAWTAPTWNNQPTTTTTGQLSIASGTGDVEIDITALAQQMLNNPTADFGLMMRLQNEGGQSARNFTSSDVGSEASRPKLVVVTAQPISPVKAQRDYIFSALDQTPINSGILSDYGWDLADQTRYDGVIRSDNEMNIDLWRTLYGEFETSVINPSSSLVNLKSINQTLDDNWRLSPTPDDRVVDIAVQFVQYQSIATNAVANGLLTIVDDRLYDVPGRTQSPYVTNYAFAAAPMMEFDDGGEVTFNFPSGAFVKSSLKTTSTLAADFDDGAGYRTVPLNTPIPINYLSDGVKTLRYKITFTDGTSYYSHSKFRVFDATAQARYAVEDARMYLFPRSTDTTFPEPGFPNPDVFEGNVYGARVTVHYPDGVTQPTGNPVFKDTVLIVAEGFDASGFSAFGKDNWSFKDFIEKGVNGGIDVQTTDGTKLNDKLAKRYTVVYVDFYNGTGPIGGNASVFSNVIRWVNAHKTINPATNQRERNIILGQSMGGLIARYALCDLEKKMPTYPDHECSTLVTQDSPHRGANVPIGFQVLVRELAGMNMGTAGLFNYGLPGGIVGTFIDLQDIVPALKQGNQLLNERATQEMLIDQTTQTNTFLNGDYRSKVTFANGYVPTFQMYAVSNGSECGQGQITSTTNNYELFYANADLYVDPLVFQLAADVITVGQVTHLIAPSQRGLGTLTEIPFHLLTPLMGKSWKTTLRVTSAQNGSNQVFSGTVQLQKKVLGIIPLNIDLYNSAVASNPPLLFDQRAGGFYPLKTYDPKEPTTQVVNAYPFFKFHIEIRVAEDFNFVPTSSALDVTTTPLTTGALTSQYTGGSNTQYPSRFANFKTQERDLSSTTVTSTTYNTSHVRWTLASSTWFLNIISGNNQIVNCAYACGTGSNVPYVYQPSTMCSSPVTFTVNNVPSGATIRWDATGPVSIPNNSTATSITVTPTGPGIATVRAILTTASCGDLRVPKTFTVGNPPWNYYNLNSDGSPNYLVQGPNPTFTKAPTTWQLNWIPYTWAATSSTITLTSPNATKISGGNGYAVFSFPNQGMARIDATTTGPCGTALGSQLVTVTAGSGFMAAGNNTNDSTASMETSQPESGTRIGESEFVYYPNPVNEELIVKQAPAADGVAVKVMTSTGRKGTVWVTLRDANGNLLRVSTKDEETVVMVDTSTLKDGLYYLTVTDQGKDYTERILIKH